MATPPRHSVCGISHGFSTRLEIDAGIAGDSPVDKPDDDGELLAAMVVAAHSRFANQPPLDSRGSLPLPTPPSSVS
jgi:hypothetical protein